MPADLTKNTAALTEHTIATYQDWIDAWQDRCRQGFETVLLTGDGHTLTVLGIANSEGRLEALHYPLASSPNAGYPPSHAGFLQTLATEQRLAKRWPELGWPLPAHPLIRGKGLFIYPLGPVRADVAESLLYELVVMGDEIVHVRLGHDFKPRHIRQIVVGRTVSEAMPVISVFTTTSTVHHSLAMALAVEHAWDLEVPRAAQTTRTLCAELERSYSHLGDLAVLAVSTGLPVPQMEYLHLKELVLRTNQALFGHRYLRGTVAPGGIDASSWPATIEVTKARETLHRVVEESTRIAADLEKTSSFLDRLHGAGIIPPATVSSVQPVGPVGRAAGRLLDVRVQRPYANYGHRDLNVPTLQSADAYARFKIRVLELQTSLNLVQRLLQEWDPHRARALSVDPSALTAKSPLHPQGIGLVEAPRGLLAYWAQFDHQGRIQHLEVATPSQRNWAAYPDAMANGNILQDFPIIDASFSLSVAGWDG